MSRLVLVGEAPGGRGTEDLPALEGLVGNRLAKMLELNFQQYRDHESIVRKNIFESPDAGVPWDRRAALLRARQLMMTFEHGDRVVVLGKRAAEAFQIEQFGLYRWVSAQRIFSGETFWLANVPHPSGRNRLLNDEAERERMAKFLREALRDSTGR